MKIIAVTAVSAGVLASGALALSTPAAAEPISVSSADAVVKHLQDQGYNVMLNGTHDGPLSECFVTGIHPTVSGPATQLTSV